MSPRNAVRDEGSALGGGLNRSASEVADQLTLPGGDFQRLEIADQAVVHAHAAAIGERVVALVAALER